MIDKIDYCCINLSGLCSVQDITMEWDLKSWWRNILKYSSHLSGYLRLGVEFCFYPDYGAPPHPMSRLSNARKHDRHIWLSAGLFSYNTR